ncbi:hypothetical protein LEP1GSC088_1120 [Leptospira interrogans str. L1207]|nr:hypothetical protein LEP1GSC088_1120 [Leptospira interrogans str. L1207]
MYKEYSENLNSILDPWIGFNFTQNQEGVIETFKYQPNFSIHLNVSKFLSLWSELYIKILENTDILENSMTYLIPRRGRAYRNSRVVWNFNFRYLSKSLRNNQRMVFDLQFRFGFC